MQSCVRTCLVRRPPCTGRLSRVNCPLPVRHRCVALAAFGQQVPPIADDNEYIPTKSPLQTAPGLTPPNQSIHPPPAVVDARSSSQPSQPRAAELSSLQPPVVPRRVSQVPLARRRNRQHSKRFAVPEAAADTTTQLYARTPTLTPTQAQIKSLQPRTRQSDQRLKEQWQAFIHRLSSLPRTSAPRNGNSRSVELTAAFVEKYTGSGRPNSWIQDVGSRAVVELLPSSPDAQVRHAILHGSDRAVELARLDLERQQAAFELADHAALKPYSTDLSLDAIDSISSFTHFVRQTTEQDVPPAAQEYARISFLESVADALITAFEHQDVSKFASTVALNSALLFLCRRDFIGAADAALRLYHAARALHLVPGISTFNILLELAIRTGNAKNASFLLREMHRENVSPNSHTWTLLFSLPYLGDRAALLRLIMESGIPMNSKGFAVVIRAAINDLLADPCPSCDDLQRLFSDMDHIFGSDWLTLDSYHHLLRLCSVEPREGVVDLLNELPSRHNLELAPQSPVFLEALKRKSPITRDRISNFVAGLSVEQRVRRHVVIPRLFLSAWQRCFYNVCAVLWSFAASRGIITPHMIRIVKTHLAGDGAQPLSRSASRRCLGARLVVGVQWPRGGSQGLVAAMVDLSPRLTGDEDKNGNDDHADDGARDERVSMLLLALQDDLNAWKRFRPMCLDSFQRWLDQAYATDERWISQGRLEAAAADDDDATVAQMLDEAVRVPLRRLRDGETNWAVQKKLGLRDRVLNAASLSRRRDSPQGGDGLVRRIRC